MNPEKQVGFSNTEFERRLRAIRMIAEQRGLDAILLFSPSNVYYFSGFFSVNLWDFQCLIIPVLSEPVLVVREFETGRFMASCVLAQQRAYPADGSGPLAVTEALRELGYQSKQLGVEMSRHLDANSFALIRSRLPEVQLCEVTDPINQIRVVKSDEEISHIRRAARITEVGMRAALTAIREGITDYQIAAEAMHALAASGSDFMCMEPTIAVGRNTGVAHSSRSGVRMNRGDPVFVELGACVWRYTVPLMRTVVAGSANAELQKLADYSSRILEAMISVLRPGVPACHVALAGQRQIAPIESYLAFHYVYGYSVGVGFPPSWLEESNWFIQTSNDRELQPGMVFHLPLMLRVMGRYGAGFSETVLITSAGAEVLTDVPRQLELGDDSS